MAPDRLRFDFSHFQAVSPEELRRIEQRVNEQIRLNAPAEIRQMTYDAAVASGAIALFGEKYGDEVRVLRVGDFSTELCGGTHVSRAGDIGLFKIVSEGGVAAGVRRIEAVTGEGAVAYVEQTDDLLRSVATMVRATREEVAAASAGEPGPDPFAGTTGALAPGPAGLRTRHRPGCRRSRRRRCQGGRDTTGWRGRNDFT